jgi:hypothetical protein
MSNHQAPLMGGFSIVKPASEDDTLPSLLELISPALRSNLGGTVELLTPLSYSTQVMIFLVRIHR